MAIIRVVSGQVRMSDRLLLTINQAQTLYKRSRAVNSTKEEAVRRHHPQAMSAPPENAQPPLAMQRHLTQPALTWSTPVKETVQAQISLVKSLSTRVRKAAVVASRLRFCATPPYLGTLLVDSEHAKHPLLAVFRVMWQTVCKSSCHLWHKLFTKLCHLTACRQCHRSVLDTPCKFICNFINCRQWQS